MRPSTVILKENLLEQRTLFDVREKPGVGRESIPIGVLTPVCQPAGGKSCHRREGRLIIMDGQTELLHVVAAAHSTRGFAYRLNGG